MKTAPRPATAEKYMQRDLVTISPTDTLKDALDLMTENHITGLPVMDTHSRCVGLITSGDILNYEHEQSTEWSDGRMADVFDPENQQWESVPLSAFGLEEFGGVPVSEVMSRELIWVGRDTPLEEVAKRMIDERVHRILVMDENSRLYGIISTTDFVRFVAESA